MVPQLVEDDPEGVVDQAIARARLTACRAASRTGGSSISEEEGRR
jgi:hypothetical protein